MASVPTTGGACIEAAPVLEVTEETSEDSPRSLTSLVQGGTWDTDRVKGLSRSKAKGSGRPFVLSPLRPAFCGVAAHLASHGR